MGRSTQRYLCSDSPLNADETCYCALQKIAAHAAVHYAMPCQSLHSKCQLWCLPGGASSKSIRFRPPEVRAARDHTSPTRKSAHSRNCDRRPYGTTNERERRKLPPARVDSDICIPSDSGTAACKRNLRPLTRGSHRRVNWTRRFGGYTWRHRFTRTKDFQMHTVSGDTPGRKTNSQVTEEGGWSA